MQQCKNDLDMSISNKPVRCELAVETIEKEILSLISQNTWKTVGRSEAKRNS